MGDRSLLEKLGDNKTKESNFNSKIMERIFSEKKIQRGDLKNEEKCPSFKDKRKI